MVRRAGDVRSVRRTNSPSDFVGDGRLIDVEGKSKKGALLLWGPDLADTVPYIEPLYSVKEPEGHLYEIYSFSGQA
jgi:hypothetical protein